jgi:hypothetical protein
MTMTLYRNRWRLGIPQLRNLRIHATIMPPLWYHFWCHHDNSFAAQVSLSFLSFYLWTCFSSADLGSGRKFIIVEIMVKKSAESDVFFPITRMFCKCSSHLWITVNRQLVWFKTESSAAVSQRDLPTGFRSHEVTVTISWWKSPCLDKTIGNYLVLWVLYIYYTIIG